MHISPGYTGTGGVVPVDNPTFFVEVWKAHSTYWECAEFELSDCDVDEALRWAKAETPDDGLSRCVLYAIYRPSSDAEACDVHLCLYGQAPKDDLYGETPKDESGDKGVPDGMYPSSGVLRYRGQP